ncbi:MAG: methyltransferase domain-containing protein [Aeropyrum sp.]|nr:methyltransferase domain-containing protein [Aeropyrum sp.]MCE4615870.1 methyltransferase domain-containing protein [Aeropyrum sp.]
MNPHRCGVIDTGCPALLLAESKSGEVRQYYVKIDSGTTYTTIAGIVRGPDIVGREWGFTVEGRLGRVAILKPSPVELMEGFYERRTQVIYPKDLGFMLLVSGVTPRSRVLEAGVGSGFLTTALALVLCPEGQIIGLDLKRENLEAVKRNLRMVGFDRCVRLMEGDVKSMELERLVGAVDAAFLDIPDPWEALPSLSKVVKPGGSLTAFIPTSSQLDKLLKAITRDWLVQSAWETMARSMSMVEDAVRPSEWVANFTGYIVLLRRVIPG